MYQKKKSKRETFWKHVFAVTLASTASKTIVAPLERIKLVIQVKPILKADGKCTNLMNTFSTLYSQQGLLAFWRGNGVNVFRIVPNSALKFTVMSSYALEYLQQLGSRVMAGFTTGVVSFIFNYPLDVVRVKLSTDMSGFNKQKIYKGMFDCTKKTLQTQGVSGLYKGVVVSSIGIVPYLMTTFVVHDLLKEIIPEQKSDTHRIYFMQLLGIGSAASMFAACLTYPLDTVRRRLQVNGSLGASREYISIKDCFHKIYTNEGMSGFYRGIGVSLIRVVPAASIQFSLYDYLKEFIFE